MDQLKDHVKCKNCGCEVSRQHKFCSECGTKVLSDWFHSELLGNFTCQGLIDDGTVCGQHLEPTVKFCANCGEKSNLALFPYCKLPVISLT